MRESIVDKHINYEDRVEEQYRTHKSYIDSCVCYGCCAIRKNLPRETSVDYIDGFAKILDPVKIAISRLNEDELKRSLRIMKKKTKEACNDEAYISK